MLCANRCFIFSLSTRVLPACPAYQSFQGLCELAVQKGITAENSAAILHTSDDLRASRLRDICMRFVVRHFDTVSKSEVGGCWVPRVSHLSVRGPRWSVTLGKRACARAEGFRSVTAVGCKL